MLQSFVPLMIGMLLSLMCGIRQTEVVFNKCQTQTMQFFVLVILDQGWAAYMWDMLRKEIHVLDPLCAQVAGAEQRHMTH